MFSKNKKSTPRASSAIPATPATPSTPSLISADLRIVGDMQSNGEIQIDGAVDGDIRTHSLLIGEGAEITGEVIADNVVVHGSITGQIKARSVQLAKTARVIGDILHEDLAIETGAFLEGHCKRMVQNNEPAKPGDGQKPSNAAKEAKEKPLAV